MLTEIQAYNNQGEYTMLSMPLGEVTNGIFVVDVQGLDPVKATIASSNFANMDGAQFHSSRREARNIKLRLGLEPDYINEEPQDVRNTLYGFFMPKANVDLRFVNSNGIAYLISGVVESFESALFTQEPMVDISIMCFDPDFIRGNIEDRWTDYESVYMYSVASIIGTPVQNPGTVNTGLTFQFSPDRAITDFTLYNSTESEGTQSMAFTIPMQAYDTLQVDTSPGKKRVELFRANNSLGSYLHTLSPQSDWIYLLPGENMFRMYEAGSGADPLYHFITYKVRYGGL